jgi:hypothetical protein
MSELFLLLDQLCGLPGSFRLFTELCIINPTAPAATAATCCVPAADPLLHHPSTRPLVLPDRAGLTTPTFTLTRPRPLPPLPAFFDPVLPFPHLTAPHHLTSHPSLPHPARTTSQASPPSPGNRVAFIGPLALRHAYLAHCCQQGSLLARRSAAPPACNCNFPCHGHGQGLVASQSPP